jgi:hypothetical protein
MSSQPKKSQSKKSILKPYQDYSLSVEHRVADLLARMTMEEKVAQLGSRLPFTIGWREWMSYTFGHSPDNPRRAVAALRRRRRVHWFG